MDRATNVMTKIAKTDDRPEPGYWATLMTAARATRRGDKGWRQGIVSDEVLSTRMSGSIKGMAKGIPVGAGIGLVSAALSKGKVTPTAGAMIGAFPGLLFGSLAGQFKADKEYLAPKGIKLKALGFKRPELTGAAKAKYLSDKYQGGGYKV